MIDLFPPFHLISARCPQYYSNSTIRIFLVSLVSIRFKRPSLSPKNSGGAPNRSRAQLKFLIVSNIPSICQACAKQEGCSCFRTPKMNLINLFIHSLNQNDRTLKRDSALSWVGSLGNLPNERFFHNLKEYVTVKG